MSDSGNSFKVRKLSFSFLISKHDQMTNLYISHFKVFENLNLPLGLRFKYIAKILNSKSLLYVRRGI